MESDQFFKSVLDNLFDGVYIVDRDRRITYWNHSAERISGYQQDKVIGSRCFDNILVHVDRDGIQLCSGSCPLAKTLHDGKYREIGAFLHHVNGHRVPVLIRVSPIYNEQNAIIGAIEIFTDNSTKLAELQKISELERDAYVDPLTQIGNRRYLQQKLQAHLDELQSNGTHIGVLLGDIDHFKKFNDTCGHLVGDQVLKMVADTLSHNLRPYDIAGRWGGEEFLLILPITEPIDLANTANRLRLLVQQSGLLVNSQMLRVTISMGGTFARLEDTPETLIARADEQLYISKHAGRNCVRIAP